MEKNEIELYRKKKKLYDKLGASKFQEVVFVVERLKYKFMKKFMPNFIEHYDKRVEKQQRIKLKKAHCMAAWQEASRSESLQPTAFMCSPLISQNMQRMRMHSLKNIRK